MNKTEYIIRQIAKTNKKSFENYVITRIWHLLNNENIQFVTQQYVKRSNGRAMTDMFFPQINLHVEVDEGHHFDIEGNQVNADLVRDADIINATGTVPLRIKVCDKRQAYDVDISLINSRIDEVILIIREKLSKLPEIRWDLESQYLPETYVKRGYMSADENVAFRTIADACNCFGNDYINVQRGFLKHPKEDKYLWFPKLYENDEWNNELSLDEKVIHMTKKSGNEEYFNGNINKPSVLKERITFARVKSSLGDVMYRFKGVYKCNVEESMRLGHFVYERISIVAITYSSD